MSEEAKASATEKLTIHGVLEGFTETGTEGVIWSVLEDGKESPAGLHCLKNGDHLRIFNGDGSIIWEGDIDLEYETGRSPFPNNPQRLKQEFNGLWVNGNQRGFALADWGELFLCDWMPESKYKGPLRAELLKG